jgi:hypothetical protein
MQYFSKLYLLTKQLQIKSELAFVVLTDSMDTKEICKRMTDMYRLEFNIYNKKADLINYLLDMVVADTLETAAK